MRPFSRRAEIEWVAPTLAMAPVRLTPGTRVELPGMPGWMITVG